MSTLLNRAEPRELAPDLLARLREHDNPFDDFVQTRSPGGSFRRRHVPAINRAVFEKLLSAIGRYQLDSQLDPQSLLLDDVPRSGVLLVLGPRGAGKTHLVHALRLHDLKALVVTPTHYEPHRPFAEYLLQLLVRSLQDESFAASRSSLARLADWFARQAAVQALYGMTETEWLARLSQQGWSFWRALFGWSSRAAAHERELLTRSLLDENCRSVHDVSRLREHDLSDLREIALRQVGQSETGRTIGAQIRRGLYLRLAELAFDGDTAPVFEFLFDGFTQASAEASPSRETLVEELLAALTELFILAGTPVVFAFDALETLLSDPPDEKRCHAFFRGLAEVLDSHRGLPFFLFAEAGHWQQAQRYLSSYAQQRLQQGVPTRGHGSLWQINLPTVTALDLEQLVAARLAGLLEPLNGQPAEQARLGPFRPEDLAAIARSGASTPPLRQMLQALRDVYQERVFGEGRQAVPIVPIEPARPDGVSAAPPIDLKEIWQREVKAAQRRLEAEGMAAQAGSVLVGLQKWLDYLAAEGVQARGWSAARSEIVTFGNNPTYGQLVRCTWHGEEEREMGIAFLLGKGSAMPRDLKEKLKMMVSSKPVVERLLILWPHESESTADASQQLPAATGKVWEDMVTGSLRSRVWLRNIEPGKLAVWLAIERWEAAARGEGSIAAATLGHFLAEETSELFWLLAPT
jgi:hypothetical protein